MECEQREREALSSYLLGLVNLLLGHHLHLLLLLGRRNGLLLVAAATVRSSSRSSLSSSRSAGRRNGLLLVAAATVRSSSRCSLSSSRSSHLLLLLLLLEVSPLKRVPNLRQRQISPLLRPHDLVQLKRPPLELLRQALRQQVVREHTEQSQTFLRREHPRLLPLQLVVPLVQGREMSAQVPASLLLVLGGRPRSGGSRFVVVRVRPVVHSVVVVSGGLLVDLGARIDV